MACCDQSNPTRLLLPTMNHVTVINDLSVSITGELVPIGGELRPINQEGREIPAGGVFPFEIGLGVKLVLIKGGVEKDVPIQEVVYASEIFPEELKVLQTIINDLAGTIRAEVRVVNPKSSVIASQSIPSGNSYTSSLGRLGVTLVIILRADEKVYEHDEGKDVKYASQLFPQGNSL